MKDFHIRLAEAGDEIAIASILTASWSNETFDPDRVQAIMIGSDHSTLIAVWDGTVVGFIDAFTTQSRSAITRWELDLMAVDLEWRKRGIGRRLVEASIASGTMKNARAARGLVGTDNLASQRNLESCGFTCHDETQVLYVRGGGFSSPAMQATVPHLHTIRVNTMRYSGIWLEGEADRDDIESVLCLAKADEIVGMLVPVADTAQREVLKLAGFDEQGLFQWWVKDIS